MGHSKSIVVCPTLLELIGAQVQHAPDGQSLLPLLANVTAEKRSISTSHYGFGYLIWPTPWRDQLGVTIDAANMTVLRTDRHRLAHFACDLPSILFDMDD
jgi:hypothetical protein